MSAKFHVLPSVAPVVLHTTRSTYRDLWLPEDLSAYCASAATLSPTLPPLVIVPQAAFESVCSERHKATAFCTEPLQLGATRWICGSWQFCDQTNQNAKSTITFPAVPEVLVRDATAARVMIQTKRRRVMVDELTCGAQLRCHTFCNHRATSAPQCSADLLRGCRPCTLETRLVRRPLFSHSL